MWTNSVYLCFWFVLNRWSFKCPACQLPSDSLLPYLILTVEFPFPLLPALTLASAAHVHPSPQPPQLCQLGKCFCFLLSPSQGSWPFGCISLRSLAYGFCLIVYLFCIYSPHFCGSKVLQMASSLQTVFSLRSGLHGLAFLPHLCPSPSCQLYSSYTLWKCSGRHQEDLLLRNYWSFLCLECFNPGYLCIYSLTSFGWHSMKCQLIYEAFSELHMH